MRISTSFYKLNTWEKGSGKFWFRLGLFIDRDYSVYRGTYAYYIHVYLGLWQIVFHLT